MKYPIGRHQKQRKRRRRGKAICLIIILAFLAVVSSLAVWDGPSPTNGPTIQQIVYARNQYRLNGYLGEAKIYIDRWPEYVDEIMGG